MRIILQVFVILLLGTLIGAADAFYFRPIKMGREAPPPLDLAPASKHSAPVATTPPQSTPPETKPTETKPAPTPPQQPASTNASTPTSAAPSGFTPTPKSSLPPGHITLDEAKSLFDAQATFIDSRNVAEYEKSHIQGAFRLELHDFLATPNPPILAMIPREGNVVVYCKGGNCDESEKVAEMLSNSGYTRVYVLHDGLPGWLAMNWPHESGAGVTP